MERKICNKCNIEKIFSCYKFGIDGQMKRNACRKYKYESEKDGNKNREKTCLRN